MNRSPLTTYRIACQNIRKNPFRTFGLMFIVGVFSLVLFCGTLLSACIQSGMESMSMRLGADMMVIPTGYDSKVEGILLRGEPSTFYLDRGLEERIKSVTGVSKVSSQLFIATLDADCCSLPIQLIGFDPETDFVINPWLKQKLNHELRDDEVIIGNEVNGSVGQKVIFFGQAYTIAERLERTGMGFDSSVFLSMNAARSMMERVEVASNEVKKPDSTQVSSIMVNVDQDHEVKDVSNHIVRTFGEDFHLDTLVTQKMIRGLSGRLRSFSMVVYGLAALIGLTALGVLALVFSISVNERKSEFGILRLLGASRAKLNRILWTESLLLSGVGAVAGLFLGVIVIFPFRALISMSLRMPFMLPSYATMVCIVVFSLLLSALIGPLACAVGVWRLGRAEIARNLKG